MFVVAYSAIFCMLHVVYSLVFRKPCVITQCLLGIEVDFNTDRPETSASHARIQTHTHKHTQRPTNILKVHHTSVHVLDYNTLQHFISQAMAVFAFKLTAGDGKKKTASLLSQSRSIGKEVVRCLKGNGFLLEDETAVYNWMDMEWRQPASSVRQWENEN